MNGNNCCPWPNPAGQTGYTASQNIALPINLSASIAHGCLQTNAGPSQQLCALTGPSQQLCACALLEQQLQLLQQLHQQNLQNMMNLLPNLSNNMPFQAITSSTVNATPPALLQTPAVSCTKDSATNMLMDSTQPNKYEATLNLKNFKPEHINVTLACDHIEVIAENQEYTPTTASKQLVSKTFTLPPNIIPETIECLLSPDGILTISAKLKT